MQTHDFDRFTVLLGGVFELYARDTSPIAVQIWWEAMRPFDLDAVQLAFSRHVQNPDTGQFPPKPADVIRMLGGTTQDSALRAWAKVDRAVRQVGIYASVVFDDALVHRVLHDMGGWVGLGTKREDEWPFVAREFENRYRGYAMRGEQPEHPAVMLGLADADNSRQGFRTDPPRLVGDAERARRVMQSGTDRPLIGFVSAAPLRLVGTGAA